MSDLMYVNGQLRDEEDDIASAKASFDRANDKLRQLKKEIEQKIELVKSNPNASNLLSELCLLLSKLTNT